MTETEQLSVQDYKSSISITVKQIKYRNIRVGVSNKTHHNRKYCSIQIITDYKDIKRYGVRVHVKHTHSWKFSFTNDEIPVVEIIISGRDKIRGKYRY